MRTHTEVCMERRVDMVCMAVVGFVSWKRIRAHDSML